MIFTAQFLEERYDGFVLYNISDKDFILNEFLPKVEDEAKIKLFLPERDLRAGVQAYYAQLDTMISRSVNAVQFSCILQHE